MDDRLISSYFESYRAEFVEGLQQLTRDIQLAKDDPAQIKEDYAPAVRALEDLLRNMSAELASLSSTQRQEMTSKIEGYEIQLKQLAAEAKAVSARAEVVGKPKASTAEFRGRAVAATQQLEQSSEHLRKAQRVAAETEQLGEQILGDLGQQRERLVKNKETVDYTSVELTRSRSLMDQIRRREMRTRLLIGGSAALLLIVLLVVIYFVFIRAHVADNRPPPSPALPPSS